MKAENVNSFVQGAQNTLTLICGETGKLGKLFVKQGDYEALTFSVVVGFVGQVKGEAIYTMDSECALHLASKVMMGMSVASMDDMARSAVSELANMISGHAANMLSKHGLEVDITPPIFIEGTKSDKFAFVKPEDKVICMPMSLSSGQIFEIDLHLEA